MKNYATTMLRPNPDSATGYSVFEGPVILAASQQEAEELGYIQQLNVLGVIQESELTEGV